MFEALPLPARVFLLVDFDTLHLTVGFSLFEQQFVSDLLAILLS
jgi:hypothetical protein